MDRIVELDGIPESLIKEKQLSYLLQDDYLTSEAILLHRDEIKQLKIASTQLYGLFGDTLDMLISTKGLDRLGVPPKMAELVTFSWNNRHQHMLGRFDFAGGIDGAPLKVLEYNADTPTMIPESGSIQEGFKSNYSNKDILQFNILEEELERGFKRLADINSDSHHSMLFTTLGYEEDIANIKTIMTAAEAAGFDVAYADLPDIEFAVDEGIFLNDASGSIQFDYLYKLVPWEFICYEEPDLLDILHNLVLSDIAYVLNPAYCMVFQNKAFLAEVFKKYPSSPWLLETKDNVADMLADRFVEKVTYGRLGENIRILDRDGTVVEESEGDFGNFPKIYQAFTDLYKDDEGDIYQAGVFTVDRYPSCLSFRRGEKLIIDDDAEFIPHFILQ